MTKPWGVMNPNSQNQMWSRWTFKIKDPKHQIDFKELKHNAVNWIKLRFGTVGQAKVDKVRRGYIIQTEVEGVPAHDPDFQSSIKKDFGLFIEKGWRSQQPYWVNVEILAGDTQTGAPRTQLVVMPHIIGDVMLPE